MVSGLGLRGATVVSGWWGLLFLAVVMMLFVLDAKAFYYAGGAPFSFNLDGRLSSAALIFSSSCSVLASGEGGDADRDESRGTRPPPCSSY